MNSRIGLPAAALLLALMAVALLRIADTYRVFNNTVDEPAHIGAGMQWLDSHQYTYEQQHPPMRAIFAVGPLLLGVHATGESCIGEDRARCMADEGRRILYESGDYKRTLSAARIGALPSFCSPLLS